MQTQNGLLLRYTARLLKIIVGEEIKVIVGKLVNSRMQSLWTDVLVYTAIHHWVYGRLIGDILNAKVLKHWIDFEVYVAFAGNLWVRMSSNEAKNKLWGTLKSNMEKTCLWDTSRTADAELDWFINSFLISPFPPTAPLITLSSFIFLNLQFRNSILSHIFDFVCFLLLILSTHLEPSSPTPNTRS